jgi:hypothetical protein
MNEEVQIDIVNLFHYILKKWRIVVIAMLVLGVVADLYYVKESSSNAAAVESQTIEEESIETQIRNVKENLTEDEMQQVDRVYTMYAYNEDSYQENAEYLDSSLLMQLNPEEIPTVLLSYQISRNISEEEIRNIMTMYESTLLDETSCADIVDVIGKKYKNTAVKELVSITDNVNNNSVILQNVESGVLNIRIYALEEKQCEKIADVIKKRMQAYTEQLQQVFGEFSVQNISEQYYLSSDSTVSTQKMNVVSAMNSAYSYMNNVTNVFTEDQLTYFNLLTKPLDESMNQEERDTAEQNVADTAVKMNYFSTKYVLVGLIAGAFLVALWYACVYIISQTVKDADDLKVVTGLPIFGTVLSNGKLDKRNKVDKWIDSLFSRGKKKEDDAVLLERICHEIELQAKKKEVKNILLTSSAGNEDIALIMDKVQQKLTELGVSAVKSDSIASDSIEALEQLQKADGVVFVEQLMKSSREDIRKETELCSRYQVEMLGNVAVGEE